MTEPLLVDRWIVETLAADATLTALIGGATPKIYSEVAAVGAAFPFVLFQMQAATDLMILGPYRVWSDMLFTVRGVAESTSYAGTLETIANRIDLALHTQEGTLASGVVFNCVRERPFRMTEVASGRQYRHSGGIFRIRAKAA